MRKPFIRHVFLPLILLSVLGISLSCADGKKEPSFFQGEKITYVIKKFGVKAGEATLVFEDLAKTKNYDAYLIVFTATGFNFFDEERITLDRVSFYPIKIERSLNILGKREKITEEYSAGKGTVKITKESGGRVTQKIIEKKKRLDNIYCFLYRYRFGGKFHVGDSFTMHLPTQEVTLQLKRTVKLKVANETFDSYYLKSEPGRYEIWFDAGPKKIPLKINGAIGFGDMTMVMVKDENKGN